MGSEERLQRLGISHLSEADQATWLHNKTQQTRLQNQEIDRQNQANPEYQQAVKHHQYAKEARERREARELASMSPDERALQQVRVAQDKAAWAEKVKSPEWQQAQSEQAAQTHYNLNKPYNQQMQELRAKTDQVLRDQALGITPPERPWNPEDLKH